MNWKFVVRGLALALGSLGILLLVAYLMLPRWFPGVPYGPTPPPPDIAASQGSQPAEWPGLQAWARYKDGEPILVGSAFFLRTLSGDPVVAAAAHSFNLQAGLERVHLSRAGPHDPLLTVTKLHREPGRPRIVGMNLTRDFVLFRPDEVLEVERAVAPDDRGLPQPGERVALYPGFGEWEEPLLGAILQADSNGAWIVMDENFQPALMSGAPVLSLHTGRVVGMALAAGEREGHTVIGIHPIGSLVEKASAVEEAIPLAEYGQ